MSILENLKTARRLRTLQNIFFSHSDLTNRIFRISYLILDFYREDDVADDSKYLEFIKELKADIPELFDQVVISTNNRDPTQYNIDIHNPEILKDKYPIINIFFNECEKERALDQDDYIYLVSELIHEMRMNMRYGYYEAIQLGKDLRDFYKPELIVYNNLEDKVEDDFDNIFWTPGRDEQQSVYMNIYPTSVKIEMLEGIIDKMQPYYPFTWIHRIIN